MANLHGVVALKVTFSMSNHPLQTLMNVHLISLVKINKKLDASRK